MAEHRLALSAAMADAFAGLARQEACAAHKWIAPCREEFGRVGSRLYPRTTVWSMKCRLCGKRVSRPTAAGLRQEPGGG